MFPWPTSHLLATSHFLVPLFFDLPSDARSDSGWGKCSGVGEEVSAKTFFFNHCCLFKADFWTRCLSLQTKCCSGRHWFPSSGSLENARPEMCNPKVLPKKHEKGYAERGSIYCRKCRPLDPTKGFKTKLQPPGTLCWFASNPFLESTLPTKSLTQHLRSLPCCNVPETSACVSPAFPTSTSPFPSLLSTWCHYPDYNSLGQWTVFFLLCVKHPANWWNAVEMK